MHKHFELYDCGLQPECGGRERRGRQRQGSNELSAGLIKNALCGVADGPLYVCASLFRNAFKMRFSVSKLPRPRTGSCIAVWKCVQNVFCVKLTKTATGHVRSCIFVHNARCGFKPRTGHSTFKYCRPVMRSKYISWRQKTQNCLNRGRAPLRLCIAARKCLQNAPAGWGLAGG